MEKCERCGTFVAELDMTQVWQEMFGHHMYDFDPVLIEVEVVDPVLPGDFEVTDIRHTKRRCDEARSRIG